MSLEMVRRVFRKLPQSARDRLVTAALRVLDIAAIPIAPLVGAMAHTGAGTNRCLKYGALPMPVHFYSPVPNLGHLEQADVWGKRSELPGVDLRVPEQLQLLREIGSTYGSECAWPALPSPQAPDGYFTENNSFSFACSAAAHTMVRRFKPGRVIEVGSGNSSRIIANALMMNQAEGAATADYLIVDPFPGPRVQSGIPGVSRVDPRPVEQLELAPFLALQANDILFIDSGHTVRLGSDVNFLFLEVLPRLAPGVVVHIHDIPMPAEYPKAYATNPEFRVFWTESYLLQAFMAFNQQFEVQLALAYLHHDHQDALLAAFPHYDSEAHRASSGSFWIRRVD